MGLTEADRNEAIAQAIMADMTEADWENLNKIGEELADETKPQDQEAPEDSTEETKESQTEEKPSEPYMAFASKEELQSYIDDRIGGRLERERNKAKEERQKAERDAARQALKDQEKYKELYEAEEATRKELEEKLGNYESLEEKHQNYVATVEEIANQRVESLKLPKGVKSLVEKMEPADRLTWLQENEEDFLGTTETVPPSPNGDDPTTTPEADENARRAQEAYTASTF